ncbi:hypothetical protein FDENT_7152 [Fusarium denticulatum]|uniref:PD-(D/E)XK nuclease-like domain-containing protein n=1 Tax=Fusarium denticulatum TaxID=48507 RepID=A0A8H5X5V4_9HYPO|nr:hypothetical protein FDENT_7152 [Fusarium denticulatum]
MKKTQPAKKLKFEPLHISRITTFPSPIEAPSPPTHGNQLPHEQEYDPEESSSQADDYQFANHWLDFKTLNPNHDNMPATLELFFGFVVCASERQENNSEDLEVIKILKAAEKCHSRQYDESGWNNLVYTPLLTAALENFKPEEHQLIDVAPCSTATIDPEWHRKSIPKGQVDFALYVDPSRELMARHKCLERRNRLGSVNHTQFVPTAEFPIAASIKTKSRQGSGQDADVQLAAWQAAQWHKLDTAVGDQISKLGFLPAIVIDGHEWRFHVTTYQFDKTVSLGLVR